MVHYRLSAEYSTHQKKQKFAFKTECPTINGDLCTVWAHFKTSICQENTVVSWLILGAQNEICLLKQISISHEPNA